MGCVLPSFSDEALDSGTGTSAGTKPSAGWRVLGTAQPTTLRPFNIHDLLLSISGQGGAMSANAPVFPDPMVVSLARGTPCLAAPCFFETWEVLGAELFRATSNLSAGER